MSDAVLKAVNHGDWARRESISHALRDLVELEPRPACLAGDAYKWCSAIFENREDLEDWENLLLLCLEAGFRHLDPLQPYADITLTHTEHHRGLVDVVFRSRKSESIADLLHAWTSDHHFSGPKNEMVDICIGRLVGVHDLFQSSPRLRRFAIHFIEISCYNGSSDAGVEKLIALLNHLHVTARDMDEKHRWTSLLFNVIQSPEGAQRLSLSPWELLVELAASESCQLGPRETNASKIAKSLVGVEGWDRLECWIKIVWTFPGASGKPREELGDIAEEEFENLFEKRRGAAQRLEEWMEKWMTAQGESDPIPESFKRIYERANEGPTDRFQCRWPSPSPDILSNAETRCIRKTRQSISH